jgi:DNA invertase Pin-like site-specific DNA recombinase
MPTGPAFSAAAGPIVRPSRRSRAGIVRSKLGRPGAEPEKLAKARRELAKGVGIRKVARQIGLGVGTVHRIKREMRVAG